MQTNAPEFHGVALFSHLGEMLAQERLFRDLREAFEVNRALAALERAFPLVLDACARWTHPLAAQLIDQVNHNVKPEEARHVLTWRYLFHQGVVPRGQDAIERYFMLTN